MSGGEKLIAFVLYPGLTLLDMVGPLQTLLGIGEPYRTIIVGERVEPMDSDTRLKVVPEATFAEVPNPFAMIVPGGGGPTIRAMANPAVQAYVRSVGESAEIVGSVCTGALILAAAGLLEGRKATTHWAYADYLNRLGATYQRARWVEDGKFITAAGVSAGIDMGLHLLARLVGEERAKRTQAGIEYDPQPPFGPMDWNLADTAAYWSRLSTDPAEIGAYFTDLLAGRPDLIAKMVG